MNTAILLRPPLASAQRSGPRLHATGSATSARLKPGDRVARKYRIRGVLGVGGFGVVYEAEHVGLRCMMAIKVLHVSDAMSDTAVSDFRQEGRIAALVHHPNLLEIHDTGTLDDGSPYLVMERVDGETLRERISRGPLAICDAMELTRQLLSALCALGEQGIVHCDVKPANLMLCSAVRGERALKLVDFGIARAFRPGLDLQLHQGGLLTGTPQYMSPEHLTGSPPTAQTDVYAAGVVLYECLAGRRPYGGDNLHALMFSALTCKAWPLRSVRADCPQNLERVVTTALQHDRSCRYASPRAMLADVEACQRERPAVDFTPVAPALGIWAGRQALSVADTVPSCASPALVAGGHASLRLRDATRSRSTTPFRGRLRGARNRAAGIIKQGSVEGHFSVRQVCKRETVARDKMSRRRLFGRARSGPAARPASCPPGRTDAVPEEELTTGRNPCRSQANGRGLLHAC